MQLPNAPRQHLLCPSYCRGEINDDEGYRVSESSRFILSDTVRPTVIGETKLRVRIYMPAHKEKPGSGPEASLCGILSVPVSPSFFAFCK